MPKFKHKPTIIEAQQIQPVIFENKDGSTREVIITNALANTGDWIATGIKGEKYHIKDEIFKELYEPVDQD